MPSTRLRLHRNRNAVVVETNSPPRSTITTSPATTSYANDNEAFVPTISTPSANDEDSTTFGFETTTTSVSDTSTLATAAIEATATAALEEEFIPTIIPEIETATDPIMNVFMALDTTTTAPLTTVQQLDSEQTTTRSAKIRKNLKALRARLSKLKAQGVITGRKKNKMAATKAASEDERLDKMADFEPLKQFNSAVKNPGRDVEEKIQIVYENQTFVGKEFR